jgi:hypothetical protein
MVLQDQLDNSTIEIIWWEAAAGYKTIASFIV